MPDLHYSIADQSDAANLAALSIEVWLHTYAKAGIRSVYSHYVLTEFTSEKFVEHLADNNQLFLKCENGDHLLGYLRLGFERPCPTSPAIATEIMTLYIQAHHGRKGIGTRLLDEAAKICEQRGITMFWLSVNHENDAAQRFYQTQKFQKNGSTYFELGGAQHENFVLMRNV